jgi:hypothetical protein
MACSTNCSAPVVSRNYLFDESIPLKHRLRFKGLRGVHGGTHSERFNSTFHAQIGYAIGCLQYFSRRNGPGAVSWVGDVGAQVCKRGCHSTGRALDVTAIRFDDGTIVDANVNWRSSQSLRNRRLYLAAWAAFRRDCTTVLTYTYNAAHYNHFHVDIDDDTTPPPIRDYAKTDTTFVQTACNLLDSAGLAVDGIWGRKTSAAYSSLLDAFKMSCKNPKGNYWHMREFVQLICVHGISNSKAGEFSSTCRR